MASHPGWSYYEDKAGKASLEPGVSGQCFSAAFGGGYGPVYLKRSFSTAQQTLYVGFTLKFEPTWMLSRMELLRLLSVGQTDLRISLLETRQIVVSTDLTGTTIDHYPGAYWWPGKWARIVIGVKKGLQGYVKVWVDGACIYSNSFDTGSKLIDELTVGSPNGWDGEHVTGKIMLDDVSVGVSFADVGSEPSRTVTVTSTVQRTVNPDNFGVNLGWYGWGWFADYPKVKALARQLGLGSGRACLQSYLNWDYHWPYFMYAPLATDPAGSSIEEHLFAMSGTTDPLMVCVMNISGEKGSDWRPEESAGLVQFNKTYLRPDGQTGLRAIYELGNETSLYGPATEGWYYDSDQKKYVQVGNGKTTYLSVFDPTNPEYLSNTNTAYNYRLDFASGDYLYVGGRWRFSGLGYAPANAGKVSGDKTLRWEYWNGTAWARFGDVSLCPFLGESPAGAHNLKSAQSWNSLTWNDDTMLNWTRASMAAISGNATLSQEQLFWIRIAHESGRYTANKPPVESFISIAVSPSGYLEAMNLFHPVISSAGGEMYAAAGVEGCGQDFLDVMEQNPALFDGVSWHSYPDPPISTAMRSGVAYVPVTAMLWSVDCLTDRAAELRQRFPGKKIALTEWNASGAPTDPIRTLAGGLNTAIGLCRIVNSGWDSATYYALFCSFYQPHALITHDVNAPRLRPSGWAFKGIKDHSRRDVITATSMYRGIYACAFGGGDQSDGALIIVNRTAATEAVSVSLPRKWSKTLAVYEMTAASLNVDNETADNVTLKYKTTVTANSSSMITYSFPPYSLTIFDTKL